MEFSPPVRLLLACLGEDPQPLEGLSLAGISAADWLDFTTLSQVQGVTPLVYQRLSRHHDSINIPLAVMEKMREVYLDNLKRNMRLYRDLELVLGLLAERHIPVIPLKGVFLAEKVYGNIGLRPMVDVDLLVPRPALATALEALDGLGYRAKYAFNIERECRTQHHLPQLYRPGSVKLEIHWNLAPANSPFNINVGELWERSQVSTLAGVEARILDPEDLLLYLCLHAAYLDGFSSKLRSFCDISWTMRVFNEKLDWQRMVSKAEGWRAQRSTWLALRISERLLGIQLPENVNAVLQPAGYDFELENWACEQILAPSEIGPKLAAAWVPQPWMHRLKHIFSSLFPPTWEMRQKYPLWTHGFSWPLAYLRHLGIVFRYNISTLWRLMRGDKLLRHSVDQRSRINRLAAWQEGKE